MKSTLRIMRMVSISSMILLAMFLTACNGGGGGEAPSERLLYSFSQGSGGFYYNPPTLVDNYIYIGTSRRYDSDPANDNYFFKLDLNLNKLWEYSLGNKEVRGGAALDSIGNIYFVVEEGRLKGYTFSSTLSLYSLDNNGNLGWSKIIFSPPRDPIIGMSNPAISTDDTIYIGGDKFYALNIQGDVLWTYGNNMSIENAPIIDPDENIYFNAAGSVISLDSNGTERWNFPASGDYFSSPAFSVDYSKIFVGVEDKVYCLESSTGNKLWEFTPNGMVGWFRATPAVDDNNSVYIGTKANTRSVFYAIKADGSGILWKNEIGADLYSSPALGDDNTVYVGSEFSGGSGIRFHALDMTAGNTKWSSYLNTDVVWSSPAISDDGTLYIGTMAVDTPNAAVYAFRTDSTGLLPNAGSPRFHEGNASTGRRE